MERSPTNRRPFPPLLKRVILLVLLAAMITGLGFMKQEQRIRRKQYFDTNRITFVPRPETIKYMTLGYENVMADLLWVRAIQYYGSKFSRMKDHPDDWYRLADALQALRPHFIKGSEFVAVAMAEGLREPAAARRYLDQALNQSPGAYEFPYNAAMFAAMIERDNRLAADYMCAAAETYRAVNTSIVVSSTSERVQDNPFGSLPYPHLTFHPQKVVLPPGEALDLVLRIARTPEVATASWEVHFDPRQLTVESVSPASLGAVIDNASGVIRVAHVYDPPIANAPLATLHARTLGSGESRVSIVPHELANPDGLKVDLFPPRFYARFCSAYRSNVGQWQIALTEWYRQLSMASNELERQILNSHIYRTLNEIDTNVLNRLLVLWLEKYGAPPESPPNPQGDDLSVPALLSDTELREQLVAMSTQIRTLLNTLYLQRHPNADPRSPDFSFEVWSDNETARAALQNVEGLWDALVPFFRHDRGRNPQRTEIDEMADELRKIYDVPAILQFRFILAHQRQPAPDTDDIVDKAFRSIVDPREGQTYWVIQKEGRFVVESSHQMRLDRENPVTEFNGYLRWLKQRFEQDPSSGPLPTTLEEVFDRNPEVAQRYRDPYGQQFVFDPETFTVTLPGYEGSAN